MRLPLRQLLIKTMHFIRGLWVGRKFDTRGLVDAGRRVKIVKQNGEIHLNKYCWLGDDVHIAVVGESSDRKAILRIGVDSGVSDRTKINVSQSVIIGNHCSIGWDCDIWDTDWHRVNYLDRESNSLSKPVVIEDHVWIGSRSIIMKGVTIGSDSVIGAGSVVNKDVPQNSLVAGHPARVIRKIAGWDRNPHNLDQPQEGGE
jgi:acetyltransferase-like isoleucine patch superfamily enzyme